MSSNLLEKRVAIVTGASSGIGAATARELVQYGASVILTARREARLNELCAELNQERNCAAVFVGDLTASETVAGLFEFADRAFTEKPSIVVVNAGRGLPGSILDSDPTQWEAVLQLNVLATFRLMREAARRFLEQTGGKPSRHFARDIVVIGSCVGRNVLARATVYSASKFAVNSAAEALRREVCTKGVRVSLVEPGLVKTEFHEVGNYGENFYDKVTADVGTLIEGQDIARAISFIVSQPPHVHAYDVAMRPAGQDYP